MNKTLSIFFSIIFCLSKIEAQDTTMKENWYSRIAISYSKGSNKSLYQFDPLDRLNDQSFYSTPSLGESILINGGIGKMFTKNIGMEANFSYLMGNSIGLYNYNFSSNNVWASTKNNQLLFLPTTIFKIDISRKLSPYIKVGLMVPLYNQSKFLYRVSDIANNVNYAEYEYEIKNQLNLGINGCVGISYKINDNIRIFFEAEEDNIRSFHTEANRTRTTISGNASLDNTILEKYVFEKSLNNNSDASKILDFPISFNREAYTIGINYFF
jgi:hypothetical protein